MTRKLAMAFLQMAALIAFGQACRLLLEGVGVL
jgi:hypothetical protein